MAKQFIITEQDLLNTFRGQRITMQQIYERHNVDTPYIKKNYKHVLRELYDDGLIEAVSPEQKPPRSGTFGDKIIVTFPEVDGEVIQKKN